MVYKVRLNGYSLEVSQDSIFRSSNLRERLKQIYNVFQPLETYIPPSQVQACLESIVNTSLNKKINLLKQKGNLDRANARLNDFCNALIEELQILRRKYDHDNTIINKSLIDFAIKSAWESATHHIVGI